MANDLFEQLSHDEIPDSPHELSRQVHKRLNPRLLGLHLAEFAVLAISFTFFHFLKAFFGALAFSLTGRFHKEGEDHAK